jgi:hypothetical protein
LGFFVLNRIFLGGASLWTDHEELEDDWRDEKDARQIALQGENFFGWLFCPKADIF